MHLGVHGVVEYTVVAVVVVMIQMLLLAVEIKKK